MKLQCSARVEGMVAKVSVNISCDVLVCGGGIAEAVNIVLAAPATVAICESI